MTKCKAWYGKIPVKGVCYGNESNPVSSKFGLNKSDKIPQGDHMKRLILLILLSLSVLTGCMTTRNGNKTDNVFPSGEQFNKKKVAILPVKSQASLTTDSHAPLKKALNKKILNAVKFNMKNSVVLDSQKSIDVLNDAGKLDLFEKLLVGYENSGAFDKKLIASLCTVLKSDFLLLAKLKVEQLNLSVLGKSFSSSLEVILLDKRSSEPFWSGVGDYKRGGVFGAGGTDADQAATELVTLAFGGEIPSAQLDRETSSNQSTSEVQSKSIKEEPVAQPAENKTEASAAHQNTPTSSTSMVVINSKAKLRKSPSTKAAVIKTLKKGEEVQMLKQKDGWCLVELAGGETGWCLKGALAQRN